MTRRPAHFRKKQKDKLQGFLITVVDGRKAGKEYHFTKEATIGRIDENDIVLIDPGISRNHARVSGHRGVFLVEDLGSSNGTRLNGEEIEGQEVLRDGDYITVGAVNLMFSNLELNVSGENTDRIHLSEKQAAKLDHTAKHEIVDIPPLKELVTGRNLVVLVSCLILWILLPFLTGRFTEILMVGLLVLMAAGILWLKFRSAITDLIDRPALLAAGLVGITVIGTLLGLLVPKKMKAALDAEWSATPIDYSEYAHGGYNSWALGYQRSHQYPGDVNYRDKVIFSYYKAPQRQRVTLEYAACGISEKEVAILLNGQPIGYVPEVSACRYNLKQALPPDKLRVGTNLVTFDNLKNGPKGTETWQISYIKFREEAIPNPNPGRAEEQYRLGLRLYEEREVAPENRQSAMKAFRLARDYVEAMPKKPPLYEDSARMLRVIDRELNTKFRATMFEAQRLVRFGKYKEAIRILRNVMLYFKEDKKDPRYIQLRQAIESISG